MAHDELLRLLGTTGNPEQTLTATGSGSARFVGKNRAFRAVLRIGGDVAGTTPSLTMRVQESPDGSGSWVTVATFAAQTDEQVGFVATTTPRYEVPGEDPLFQTFQTTKDYVRADYTISGTTPSFGDTSLELRPIPGFVTQRSGVL